VQEIRGQSDAKATEIYAKAYTQNPQAAEFYGFLKSMETYRKVLTKESTLILSTDSDLFNTQARQPENQAVRALPVSGGRWRLRT
jgi:membrane protease subunit HflC